METEITAQVRLGLGEKHGSWPNPNAIGYTSLLSICLTQSSTDSHSNIVNISVHVLSSVYFHD